MRRTLAALAAVVFVLGLATPASAANLLTNAGFEDGSLSGWSCSNGAVVTSPVHSGSYALAATATASDTAQCAQTVSVVPNTTYTVSAWVRGNPVYLGVTGGPSTWNAATGYAQLSLTFTTGAGQTSAQLYLHGWYGAGTYHADDVVLDGPGGGTPGGSVFDCGGSGGTGVTWLCWGVTGKGGCGAACIRAPPDHSPLSTRRRCRNKASTPSR